MKRLNLYLIFSSISVLLITIERFSITTKILLQPFNFLRLHELIQISVLILFSTLIPCFIFYHLTSKLESLKSMKGKLLSLVFITGLYFYATGNGIHEISSFFYNTYCPQNFSNVKGCSGLFFDDYYFGNVVYFIGAFLMTIPLLLFEKMKQTSKFLKMDYVVLIINSLIYTFAITAYAAFDKVVVGFIYVLITAIVVNCILLFSKTKYTNLPFTLYNVLSFSLSLILSTYLRFLR